jgi:hypothetical protein
LTYARDLFEMTIDSEGSRVFRGFSNIEDFAAQLDSAGLNELLPAYQPDQSAARVVLDVRGLPAVIQYTFNSTTLNFSVPSLGIDLNFTGATWDESRNQFFDYLKGEGGGVLTLLLKGFVRQTSVDPVAGNPNSLMAQMAGMDYAASSTDIDIEDKNASASRLLGIRIMAGNSEAAAFRTNMVSLPINYIIPLGDPRYQFIIDATLRYLDVEGAGVYDGSLGIGLRFPVLDRPSGKALSWSLLPMVRAGIVATQDIGARQAVYSASATSKLKFFIGDLSLIVNNMAGYYQTGTAGGNYTGDYDLENVIFRNGIALNGSLNFHLFDGPTSWQVQFVDTRITGDDWFIDAYNELAVAFGSRRREDRMTWQTVRIGAKYTFADEYDGLQFVIGYRF